MAVPTAPGRIDRAAAGLRRLVAAAPGARLPGERDLAERLRVPRPRLRRLLADLEQEGLVVRRHGSGTYAVGGGSAPAALRQVTLLLDADFKLGRDPFCATVIEHLEAACAAAGARLALARTDGAGRPTALGDGAIALGTAGARLADAWREDDPPLVALFADAAPGRRASVAQLDDAAAGADAARALVDRGCASLLFVGRRDLSGVRARLAGAQAHARTRGVALAQRDCALTHAGGLAAAPGMAIDARTGVIAANDWLAVGLRAGLAARGGAAARAPIVAFDGLAIAADPALAIASLQPPYAAIAADALAELARLRVVPGRELRYACAWRG